MNVCEMPLSKYEGFPLKNNRLSVFWMMLAGLALTVGSGCASTGSTREAGSDADKAALATQKTSPLTTDEGHVGGVTRFTEESVDALIDDDFWETGMVAQRADDGRLVYVSNTSAINDPERTRRELAYYKLRSEPNIWVPHVRDPVTGQLVPITQSQVRRTGIVRVPQSAVPDQRRVIPSAPRIRPQRPLAPRRTTPSRDTQRRTDRR
jgi:hypothetical protein